MSRIVRLGSIAEIFSGGTPSRNQSAYWSGSIPWVKTSQVQNGIIQESDIDEWITEEGFENSSARMVPKGAILMAMYGQGKTRGQVAVLGLDATINQACAAIIVKNGVDPRYVFQQLLFRYESIRNLSNTGSQENLNSALIKSISFPLPSLATQEIIASILSTWDFTIERTEQLITAKEKRNGDIFRELLFGKIRLGKRATTNQQKTKCFSIPNDWRIVKIGSIAKEVSRRNQNGDNFPVLSCTKHQGLVDSLEYFDRQIYSKDTSAYKVVEHGEFAYATNHIEEGSIGYQDLYPKGLVSPMYTVFKADPQKINDGYLYKLLKTETFRHIFEINTSASVDRRGSLRWKEFSTLPVPLPTLGEQAEINEMIGAAEKEVVLLGKQLELLKRQKRGLMQKLLTGEWLVKIDASKTAGETESNRGNP